DDVMQRGRVDAEEADAEVGKKGACEEKCQPQKAHPDEAELAGPKEVNGVGPIGIDEIEQPASQPSHAGRGRACAHFVRRPPVLERVASEPEAPHAGGPAANPSPDSP